MLLIRNIVIILPNLVGLNFLLLITPNPLSPLMSSEVCYFHELAILFYIHAFICHVHLNVPPFSAFIKFNLNMICCSTNSHPVDELNH